MDDLLRLINGYQVSQAIHVAVTLGVPDRLADGARDAEDLAVATGAHAPRSVPAAAGARRRGHPARGRGAPLRAHATRGGPAHRRPGLGGGLGRVHRPALPLERLVALVHGVRTGEQAFAAVHGVDVWTYRAEHPEESEIFDAAMTALATASRRGSSPRTTSGASRSSPTSAEAAARSWPRSSPTTRTCGASCSTGPGSSPASTSASAAGSSAAASSTPSQTMPTPTS